MANTEICSDFSFYKLIYINTILDVAPYTYTYTYTLIWVIQIFS